MTKQNFFPIGAGAAFGLALIALPASSARPQKPDASTIARLQQKIDELQAELQAQRESRQVQEAVLADADGLEESGQTIVRENQDPGQIERLPRIHHQQMNIRIC